MDFREEDRNSAWESIRKLLNATRENQVLTPEEVFHLGAYCARDSQNMVTLPLALVKDYDLWLRTIIQSNVDYDEGSDVYNRLHAKLEEYLLPEEQDQP